MSLHPARRTGRPVTGLLLSLVLSCALLAVSAPAQENDGAPDRYRAVVELEIGEVDGPRALTFVSGLVAAEDRIYVAQEPENVIRVFSLDGDPLAEWGGVGAGPGEFRRFDWMGEVEGLLWVVDLPQGRLTAFDHEGRLQATRPMPQVPARPPLAFAGPVFPTVANGAVIFGIAYGPGSEPLPRSPGVLVDPRDRVVDSVPSIRWGDRRVVIRSARGNAGFPRPLYAGARFAMEPGGAAFVLADSDGEEGLTLVRYDVRSRRADTTVLGLPDVPVPQAFADSVQRAAVELWSARLTPFDRRTIAEALKLPGIVPAVDALLVAPNGEVWLRAPNFGPGPDLWRIVDAAGRIRAEVEVERGLDLRAARGERLWAVRVDEYDVNYIQALRLEPIGG